MTDAPNPAMSVVWWNLARAIDAAVVANSHLAATLDPDHLPATSSLQDGVAHYGEPNDAFQRWAAWRAVERLREAWSPLRAPEPVQRSSQVSPRSE